MTNWKRKEGENQDSFLFFFFFFEGKPLLVAEGQIKQKLEELKIKSVQVSVTHQQEYAYATVILLKQ